jgi:hypothetical protein
MRIKNVTDAELQPNCLHLPVEADIQAEANQWFWERGNNRDVVYMDKLFEDDSFSVWEAYQDSGSVDYLYIIQEMS